MQASYCDLLQSTPCIYIRAYLWYHRYQNTFTKNVCMCKSSFDQGTELQFCLISFDLITSKTL